tara:strand:- start:174 stop:665 length:492 start_codon:yes stop_codon:yes gene_type:complete
MNFNTYKISILFLLKIFLLNSSLLLAAPSIPLNTSNNYQLDVNAPTILKDIIKFLEDKDYQSAIDAGEKAVKYYPDNADAWNYLGYSFRKAEFYDQSKIAYEKALKINPKHTGALEYYGELFLTLGQLNKAQEMLNRLKDICSINCNDMKKLEKAIKEYKENQ